MLSSAARTSATLLGPARPYVLLVDDHRPTLRQLQEVIALEGYECMTAGSGAEAIRQCDRRPPRVVITDLAMPNLDGRGLARWLRARFPSVPLILVTGEILDGADLAALFCTFSAVYSKPVDVSSLLEHVARIMPPVPRRAWRTSRP